MSIDSSTLYMPCPCGSGSKFKFCCWPKYRDRFDDETTRAQIVQTVRCSEAGIYAREFAPGVRELCEQGREALYPPCDPDKGRELFHRARELDPRETTAWNNEALCYWLHGDVEKVCELQLQGIEHSPYRNTFGFASMAIYLHALGRDDESSEWIARSLEDRRPIGRDVVVQVCKALALFRRHREIVDYATASFMDDDARVAYFKGIALANLGEAGRALPILNAVNDEAYEEIAQYYVECIQTTSLPISVYGDEWPYFCYADFPPAHWFENALAAGRDPFERYPNVTADAIEVLITEEIRKPQEMLSLIEGREGERMEKLRQGLKELVESGVGEEDADELPPGVTAVKDNSNGFGANDMYKWQMKLEIKRENTPENDAETVLDGFVRPYFEKYCSLGDHEDGERFDIALMEYILDSDRRLTESPIVMPGRYDQFGDMFRKALVDLFDNCFESEYLCEVSLDTGCGGPILALNGEKTVDLFMVSIPDRY